MKKVFIVLMVLMTMTFFISAQDQPAPAYGDSAQTTDNQAMGSGDAAGKSDDAMGAGDTSAQAPAAETPAENAGETGKESAEGTETTEQPAQTASVARQKISELIGYNIVNANGEAIGEIKDFVVTMDGKVPYATAKFNEIDSDGNIIVPVKAFTFKSTEGEAKGATIGMDVAQLEGAPVVKDDKLDGGYAQQASSFWNGKITGVDETQLGSGEGQAYLASQILDYDVKNTNGDSIGNVKDLMVDLEKDQVAYVAMGVGGFLGIGENLFAVPIKDFSVSTEEKDLVLGVSSDLFDDAKGFDNDNWPTEASANWQEDIQSQKAAAQTSEQTEAVETNPEAPAETTDGTMGSGNTAGSGDAAVPPAGDTSGAPAQPDIQK